MSTLEFCVIFSRRWNGLWYCGILCYIFLRVEHALVVWNFVLYFSECGTCSGIVEFSIIYFCMWNALWCSVIFFCVWNTLSHCGFFCYIFLHMERALVFSNFVLYIFSAYETRSGIVKLCVLFFFVETRSCIVKICVIFFCTWNTLSHSSYRWNFHFHSYVLLIYVCLYWLLELVVFYSLVRRRYIRKVSVQLVPKYFSRGCSTDSISCSERKKPEEKNVKTRQQIKKRGSKYFFCRQSTWLIIAPLLHRYCSAVAPLTLRCRTAVAALSLLRCSVVAPLLHRYRYTIAPLLLVLLSHRYRTTIAPLLLHCHSAAAVIATQSHRYHSTVAPLPLLSLLLS